MLLMVTALIVSDSSVMFYTKDFTLFFDDKKGWKDIYTAHYFT